MPLSLLSLNGLFQSSRSRSAATSAADTSSPQQNSSSSSSRTVGHRPPLLTLLRLAPGPLQGQGGKINALQALNIRKPMADCPSWLSRSTPRVSDCIGFLQPLSYSISSVYRLDGKTCAPQLPLYRRSVANCSSLLSRQARRVSCIPPLLCSLRASTWRSCHCDVQHTDLISPNCKAIDC